MVLVLVGSQNWVIVDVEEILCCGTAGLYVFSVGVMMRFSKKVPWLRALRTVALGLQ